MDYKQGYVYELMDQGGPTDNREPYFKEAVDEMMRARTLCARANAAMPDDPGYVSSAISETGSNSERACFSIIPPFSLPRAALSLRMVSCPHQDFGSRRSITT